jgi:hypothetical protein
MLTDFFRRYISESLCLKSLDHLRRVKKIQLNEKESTQSAPGYKLKLPPPGQP